MDFKDFYLQESIGIDNPKPPVSGFKKIFLSWSDEVRIKFAKAVNAWHGITMQDNTPDLLIRFAKEYPKEMEEYHNWLKSIATEESFELYRGFYGDFAKELAERIWDAIKTKKPFVEIELKEFNPWSTNKDVARSFSDAIIIKYEWNIDNVFHADAGRGFLKQTSYREYVKLSRTEREIVIKYTGKIKIDPVKDVILRGKYRSRQLRLNKKELEQNFESKLEVGRKYLPKKDIELPPYWEDILEKGGIQYISKDENGLKFKWPDGSEHIVGKNNFEWLMTYLDI
jgi:hypothetical protein